MSIKPIEILLVEDSLGDVELIREGLIRSKLMSNVHVASDGVEAIAYLSGDGDHRDRPLPDLVLLDINLPKKNGHEVLAEMRNDDSLRDIPVVVLTTSDHDSDVLRAYQHHANAYIQKPLSAVEFIQVVQKIERLGHLNSTPSQTA
ncbi:MAG: CheY-like chemotaxis protein [Planctomycetota bacterium]|jgi:CheY-like chemotaxis protein